MTLFSGSDTVNVAATLNQAVIEPQDELVITVTAVEAEMVAPFNVDRHLFRVTADGDIILPIVGGVHVAGMSELQAADTLTSLISTIVRNPVVDVKLRTIHITVLGEVNRPGCFNCTELGVNSLPEALGLANGITANGRTDNVLVIRKSGDQIMRYRVNINSDSMFSSPAYLLRKGDIIYISPRHGRSIRTKQSNFTTL